MSQFAALFPYLYMAAFIGIGWRLFVLRWDWRLKAASGAAMVIAPPLLFILPAVTGRSGDMGGLLIATGVGMLVMGLLCLAGGVGGAWLRARARAKK